MATTTPNFGWVVPTSTDLVKDGATAIETLGDSIDASLVDLKGGTTGQVLAKNSATDMDFIWTAGGDITGVTAGVGISGGGTSGDVTVTNSMATAITTNGDLIYGTGSGTFTRRAIGTTGQILTVAGGIPTWSTPAGGGKLLQVVNFVGGSATTTSSNNNSDTGLAASITPTSATSKILVTIHQNGMQKSAGSADNCMSIFLYRNAVNITATDFAGAKTATAFEIGYGSFSMSYLDSPATTSAITYKTQFRSRGNTASVTVQSNGAESYMTLMEIGA